MAERWMLRSFFLLGADAMSARSKKNLWTAQENFLHGAPVRGDSGEDGVDIIIRNFFRPFPTIIPIGFRPFPTASDY